MTILAKLSPADTSAQLLYKCPEDQNVFLSVSAVNRNKSETPEASIYMVSDKDLSVNTITVDLPGTGITTTAPAVYITGGDPKTSAGVSITAYKLTEIAVNNGGTGYAVGNLIQLTFTGATVSVACSARVTSVGAGGVITGLAVNNGVLTSLPTNITPAVANISGSGANATVTGAKFGIYAISVISKGAGYNTTPYVTFNSVVTGAGATANMTQVPEDDDLIEVGVALPYGKSPLIRDRLRLSPGQSVFVKSSVANAINFHAYGVPAPV